MCKPDDELCASQVKKLAEADTEAKFEERCIKAQVAMEHRAMISRLRKVRCFSFSIHESTLGLMEGA